jgi:hypothetical protein
MNGAFLRLNLASNNAEVLASRPANPQPQY